MRFLHVSDLHFGKSIHGVSLLERGDQPAWVERFLALARELRPEAVVLAGDIYDRGAPSGEAVALLDRMITGLAELEIQVMLVAGNHDSGQRLSFGGSLLAKQNVHISGVLTRKLPCVTLHDQYGPVTFWLMPYLFPALAAQVLEDGEIRDYDAAVRRMLEEQSLDRTRRNVLVAHQNVTAAGQRAVQGGSESMAGGVGQVDYRAFDAFEYAALGHIHAAYPVGRPGVRYAGSPLCYHFDETRQPRKGPLLVELGPKGTGPAVETLEIPPLHPMRESRGTYAELQTRELQNTARGEYLRLVLTDRRAEPEIYGFFQGLCDSRDSVLMELKSEYHPFDAVSETAGGRTMAERTVEELFLEFYEERRGGTAPDGRERALLRYAGELTRRSREEDPQELACQAEALRSFALEQEERA